MKLDLRPARADLCTLKAIGEGAGKRQARTDTDTAQ
jgi:hypothetical protein